MPDGRLSLSKNRTSLAGLAIRRKRMRGRSRSAARKYLAATRSNARFGVFLFSNRDSHQ